MKCECMTCKSSESPQSSEPRYASLAAEIRAKATHICPTCNEPIAIWDAIQNASGVFLHKNCLKPIKFAEMLKFRGSIRRLLEDYWSKNMTAAEEREIESSIPPEVRIGYKPISS